MKKLIIFLSSALCASLLLNAQKSMITLKFTGLNDTWYSKIDSVRITNITAGCDTLLLYPDTVLRIEFTQGIDDPGTWFQEFRLENIGSLESSNKVRLYLPASGVVEYVLTDISGRIFFHAQRSLEAGMHEFLVTNPGSQLFIFTVNSAGTKRSVKIPINNPSDDAGDLVVYHGKQGLPPVLKFTPLDLGFSYRQGDKLLFAAYSGSPKSGYWDSPESDEIITFQFANNTPCISEPEITYEGQVYHAIQIGNQCWLKENLNVGIMIPGSQGQADNGIMEKYCYDDNPDNCTIYGGLYQWGETVKYQPVDGTRGICPEGWHVATDLDWKILEGVADSQFGIGDPAWDGEGARGTDAGNNLKSGNTWNTPGGQDTFGFSALAAGFTYYGMFVNQGKFAHFWTSTPSGSAGNPWMHWMRHDYSNPGRDYFVEENGRSVRCVKN